VLACAAPASHALNSERRPRSAGGTTHTRRVVSHTAPMPFAWSLCSKGTRSTPSHVSSTLRLRGRYISRTDRSDTNAKGQIANRFFYFFFDFLKFAKIKA
jgi:hypothetical protein